MSGRACAGQTPTSFWYSMKTTAVFLVSTEVPPLASAGANVRSADMTAGERREDTTGCWMTSAATAAEHRSAIDIRSFTDVRGPLCPLAHAHVHVGQF